MIVIQSHPNSVWPEQLAWIDVEVLHEEKLVSSCYISFGMHLSPMLCAVVTVPEYRQRGFAHELMRGVEQALIEHGLDQCYLETGREGHPRHLYEAHGWRGIEYGTWYGERVFAMEWKREWRPNAENDAVCPIRAEALR